MSKYLSALIFFVLFNFLNTSNTFAQGQNESIEDYLKQLESYRKSGDEDDINRSLLQIAFLFWNKGKGKEAIKYFEESIKINEGIGNQAGAAHAYNNIGIIYSEQNDKTSALTNLEKALLIRKSLKDKSGISNSLLHIGIINYEQGNFNKSISVLEECLKIATEIRSVMEITDSYLYLSQANEAAGNGEEALKYHKLYTQGVKFEGNDYINGLTQKFEADKSKLEKEKHYTALELEKKNKELEIIKLREREIAALAKARKNEIALLKKTKELQDAKLKEQEAKLRADRIFQTSLIAGIILVFLLAAVIAWAYFQKIKTNKLLTTQKREIEKKSIQLRVQNEKVVASEEKILQKNRELKAKNNKLIELNDEVGNLNNLILNDLNVPLAHIDDLVDLVHNNVKEISTEQKEQINRIVESKKHLQALIKDMEEIQKIKTQIGQVTTKEIDLNKVLQNVINSTNKEEAEKKELVIHSNFEMNESLVKVDEKYVTQVFKNLLSNAAKFSPPGKKIYVNMTNKDGKFKTEIKDEGPGLSEKDREKLFSKFQKLSTKPTAGEVSTGLGLSIVKEYTELLNGKVWCESELGKGSSFFVEFEALN